MKIRKRKKDIKKFFNQHNICDLNVVFGEDYGFEDTTNTISIGITKGGYEELLRLVKKLGYANKYNLKDICFFHELGHYFTYKNFNEKEEKYDSIIREHLYNAIDRGSSKIKDKALRCYYHLPQEIEATRYGLNMLDKVKPIW